MNATLTSYVNPWLTSPPIKSLINLSKNNSVLSLDYTNLLTQLATYEPITTLNTTLGLTSTPSAT